MKLVLAKTLLLVFLFLTLTIAQFSVCIGICRENEQQALENLKKEAYDPEGDLFSWIVGKDCCEWEGVVCHNLTRRVIELQILSTDLKINNLEWLPSLVNLENLGMLNVDLSKATNWLQVINMLPSLVKLSLINCSLQHIPPLNDHHNFSSLETLDISLNNFSSSVPKWVFSLPTLVYLDLSESNFIGQLPEGPVNLTSLTTFEASRNSFNSLLPKWLFDLTDLEYLDLSYNLFEGEIPELFNGTSNFFQARLGNFSSLKELRLSNNKLTGTLPRSMGCLSMLEYLDISNNRLEGNVTESHFTGLVQLKYFSALENNLTLKVSQNWIPPFQARFIAIGSWNMGPQFPTWLQTQKEIMVVDISNGGIEGKVPAWFWNFSSQLFLINLSHNHFTGEVSNITQYIEHIYLGSNNFSGPLPQISTNVRELDLSNNYFTGGLSHFLCERNNESYKMDYLNLGGNDLSGEIPSCWMNWPKLTILILRDNNLIGGMPRSIGFLSDLKSLDFRRNSLTGPLTSSLGNCTNLLKIDLAENEFVGQLPPWLGMRLSSLMILSLRANKFHGKLPQEICHLKDLQILDLANNNFFGIIPSCISKLRAMITGKELGEDTKLYLNSVWEIERESAVVTTKGNTYMYDTILKLVTSLDMSNNNLSGDIPISLTSLVGLRFCNFSKNHLSGMIPNSIGDMKVLESFDLSENQLSGQIPQSLSSLSFLSYLNLSYNNLAGKIPTSTQLQGLNSSCFEGNEQLCGLPLLKNCSSNGPTPILENEVEEESNDEELNWFYISMSIGFGLSFWAVGASLIFKRSWRHAYFPFLDSNWNSLRAKLKV